MLCFAIYCTRDFSKRAAASSQDQAAPAPDEMLSRCRLENVAEKREIVRLWEAAQGQAEGEA